ncbi:bifunctional 2-polyprenyl-6-hydroxyphenol methylase/3-demethylubiquinol 3-O-methyltransferase UbiG [Aestuariibacter salexigens]|uniref:bifunctional 2-polyprenyl-6-hydroxyphenol methylase/3-demethylubiquinol 3-O-methyltransferase UbiG n=1 Tax=Aestuariibacter salexigens TaxID=226010 RepID=UPI00042A2A94|nr:bifunctional 2-polyprenyl-6-hydroxyphenol methylase/3-demethylubiquinol 3-O-methyltransferase UbiG [Aestuariibacter salexigens]
MLDKSELSDPISQHNSVSAEEVKRFDSLAESWWDPNGKYKTALLFNQARLSYMVPQICRHFDRDVQSDKPLDGLSVVDIGSGGGLISEPLAAKGANVLGVDPSAMSVEVARRHALKSAVNVEYRHCLAESLVNEGQQFDIVINAEVVEHVPDQQALIGQCCQLVKPGGMLILATLNRTFLSYLVAIIGAEYVLRYLPVGTHSWKKFVKPSELQAWSAKHGLVLQTQTGMKFNPLSQKWSFTKRMPVNYVQCYRKS